MLRRSGLQAIQALLELALDPARWRSGADLAASLGLPAPKLEQLLLQLRRAGLLEARRGRSGGYRLAAAADTMPLATILRAVAAHPSETLGRPAGAGPGAAGPGDAAGERAVAVLEGRLRQALERELERLTLAELLFDLRSARASLSEEGGLLLG